MDIFFSILGHCQMSGSSRRRRSPSQPLRRHLPDQLGPKSGAGQVPDRRGEGQRQRHGRPEQDGSSLRHPGSIFY